LTAGLMAGVLLICMGVAGLGRLIQFIPHPVTTGFTAGIATVIATLQLRDVFALNIAHMPETYLAKLDALWAARGSARASDFAVAVAAFALLIGLPKQFPRLTARVPAPLIAIVFTAVAVAMLRQVWPEFSVSTIGSRFQTTVDGQVVAGIPSALPMPMLPWEAGGLSLSALNQLASAAFSIAILGAIESLLSAVIADGMTGKQHDPDAELIGLGIGNVITPFFGGIAATGALARTATNIRAGGRSPVAGIVHALVVALVVLLFAPLVKFVPTAALAALLLLVAWNMLELRHIVNVVRVAPRSDVVVLLLCYVLTVVFDMVVSVSVGVVLAAFLFMRRMAELTHSRVLDGKQGESEHDLAPGVSLYEIAGPLFFGAAQRAMGALGSVGEDSKVVVLALGRVPAIDATGFVALESALQRLRHAKKLVVVAGPLPEPRTVFDRANLSKQHDHVFFSDTLTSGILLARELSARDTRGSAGSGSGPGSAIAALTPES
jgi:sulfate permease, SulP family